jgi:hypothetical protein
LSIVGIGGTLAHATEAEWRLAITVQGLNDTAVVALGIVVNRMLQRVVVLDHARPRVEGSDREMSGVGADVDQSCRNIEVEARDQYDVSIVNITNSEVASTKGTVSQLLVANILML